MCRALLQFSEHLIDLGDSDLALLIPKANFLKSVSMCLFVKYVLQIETPRTGNKKYCKCKKMKININIVNLNEINQSVL